MRRTRAGFLPICALLAMGCGTKVPPPPQPVPVSEPAGADEAAVREALGAEPVRVGPALTPVIERAPAEPGEGTPFLLVVRPAEGSAPLAQVEGSVAERTLAFVPGAADGFWTVAPAPLGAREVEVTLKVHYVGGTVREESRLIPVNARTFPSENLSVARRFTNPPPAALRRIQEERELVAQIVRRVTPEALWSEPFAKPREGRKTSGFGTKRLLNGELRSRHLGYDIQGASGDPVHASNRGRVVLARDLYFSGNSVYLDHGLGLFTAYFHMSEILVQEGDWVEQGQRIGSVGATGRVTGPHLHWSVSFQGIPLDPEHLMTLGRPPPPSPLGGASTP